MKSVKILLACLVVILVFSTFAYAEVPKMINYQGKITTPQGALISDTFSMVFSIYADSTSGTALWTETQSSVKVEFGVFSVLLGSVNPIPATVFDGNTRYLDLKVGNDDEMTPRKAIVSVGYAYHSGTADTAHFAMPDADWTINGDMIYHLNGNVGIGTTGPEEKLEVRGGNVLFRNDTGDSYLRLNRNNESGTAGTGRLLVTHSSSNQAPYAGAIHLEPLWYNGSNYEFRQGTFMVDASGNVGIGTTSPDQKLSVNGVLGIYPNTWIQPSTRGLFLYHAGNSGNIFAYNYPTGDADPLGLAAQNISLSTYISGNVYQRLFVHNNGNVGIGTTSPESNLDVRGIVQTADDGAWPNTKEYASLGITRANVATNNSYIGLTKQSVIPWGIGISSGENFIVGVASANPERTIPTPLFAINPFTGNVGIGTTSPGYKLHVNGDIRSEGTIYGNFAGTIDNADKLDGYHNGQVSADIWDGHHWGDTYPGASNSDLVDGIHGTQFLRNDQSGTLNGSLTMGGDINLGSNRLNMTGERWLRPNFESDEIFLNTDLNTGIIFRFSDPYRKIRFSHDGTNGYITSYGSGGLVLQSSTNGITLDAANNVIAAERINPSVNNAFPLGGASERWADGWFVNLHYSGTLYHSHSVESKLPLNNTEIEDGDVIVYNPETGKWEKCNSEKTLDFVSVAVKSTAEEMKVDPENIEGFEGRPVILGVYHVKVIGKVKKGQILVSSSTLGCAKAVDATVENLPYRIGRPVELKDTEGIGLIKAYFNIK